MMNWLRNEESGQGMVEYGLILVLVSIVAIGALKLIGNGLNTNFESINKHLGGTEEQGGGDNTGEEG